MQLCEVPLDIWSQVIGYLPNCDVEKLCELNLKVLRGIGLDARFQDVNLDKRGHAMKLLCELLTGRNDVAVRVRRLMIKPWLVQPQSKPCATLTGNTWNRINTFLNPKYLEQEAEKRVEKRINKDIKRITAAFRNLRNVREYHILCDERSQDYHLQLVETLLSPTLEVFSSSLVKLTIKVPFELLPNLSYVRLPELRYLEVQLCTGDARMDQVKYALDGFFVFVHNLLALEHLGVTATSASRWLDLSYFDKRWGTFPHFESFSLSIPFDGGLLFSPEGLLTHILAPHNRTLEKLKLSTSSCCVGTAGALPQGSHFWIQRILVASLGIPFPRLREVELALRPLRAQLSHIFAFLECRAPTLEKLWLTDRALRNHELEELFDALVPHSVFPAGQNFVLRNLKIKINYLNAPLFLLIAERFPRLETLGISFTDVGADDFELVGSHNQQKLTVFARQLRSHATTFAHWRLRKLNLVEGPPSFPWMKDLEDIFVTCFPPPLSIGEFPPGAH